MPRPSKRKGLQKNILTRSKCKKLEEEKKSTNDNNEDSNESPVNKTLKNPLKELGKLKEHVVVNKLKTPVESIEEEEYGEEGEDDGTPFGEYPELEKMMNEPTVKEMFEHYEKELQLADETPEKKKRYKEDPDDYLVIMRNSASEFKNMNTCLFKFCPTYLSNLIKII